jgi:hypothetical protein
MIKMIKLLNNSTKELLGWNKSWTDYKNLYKRLFLNHWIYLNWIQIGIILWIEH